MHYISVFQQPPTPLLSNYKVSTVSFTLTLLIFFRAHITTDTVGATGAHNIENISSRCNNVVFLFFLSQIS